MDRCGSPYICFRVDSRDCTGEEVSKKEITESGFLPPSWPHLLKFPEPSKIMSSPGDPTISNELVGDISYSDYNNVEYEKVLLHS